MSRRALPTACAALLPLLALIAPAAAQRPRAIGDAPDVQAPAGQPGPPTTQVPASRSDGQTPPAEGSARSAGPQDGPTLAAIKARGHLRCGVSSALAGFGHVDGEGHWSGFDIDVCRAVASAVFGEPSKVEFVPLTNKERFGALSLNRIDLLSRDTTWTLSREVANDILFAGVDYYDGQGFIVRKSLGVTDASALASKSICVQQDTTSELNATDFFRQRGLKYEGRAYPTSEAVENAYRAGQCAAYTTDATALFVLRASLPDPDQNLILPQIISKEPLGPAVRQGDDRWFLIVRWTLMAMIDAEEMGITQANVDAMARGDNPRVKRLLGLEGSVGASLGLSGDWAYRIIKYVGNYADVFRRNLGEGSPLKIKRGLNELWTRGGLMYAAPIQ